MLLFYFSVLHGCNPEPEETYTSLSEYHDYEPSLEFDDSELIQTSGLGKLEVNVRVKVAMKFTRLGT